MLCIRTLWFIRKEGEKPHGRLILDRLEVMLGVRPAAPGFETIRLSPHPVGKGRLSGRVPTRWGELDISAWNENGTIKTELTAPDEVLKRIER